MSQKLDVLSKYPDAVELGELYRQAGFDLYLVGGLVRDELRNTPGEFTDFDMTTNATPAQSEQILSAWGEHIWDIGKEYGTISARKNGAVYEVTTYRAEVYVADSRKPTVEFGLLVPVNSTPYNASIPGLSTSSSLRSLTHPKRCQENSSRNRLPA